MLAEELGDLKKTDPQQRVEEYGKHQNHEQRPTIAQLIAHFATKNEFDVF
jgi:hypothetical protein